MSVKEKEKNDRMSTAKIGLYDSISSLTVLLLPLILAA